MSHTYSKSKNLPIYEVNGSDFLLWKKEDYIHECDAANKKAAFLSGVNCHGDVFNFFASTVARDGATFKGLLGNINDFLDQSGLLTFNDLDLGFTPVIVKFDEIPEKIRSLSLLETDHLMGSHWADQEDIGIALVPIDVLCPGFFQVEPPSSANLNDEDSIDTFANFGSMQEVWADLRMTKCFDQYTSRYTEH